MSEAALDILLVEDNPNDVELTLHAFRKQRISNEIRVVEDGAEALEFVFGTGRYAGRDLSRQPMIILLDLKLPKVGGIEVLRRLKSDPLTKTIPVVVLTSSRENCDIAECYRLGANSYIVKPVDFEKFVDSVRTLGLYWLLLNQSPLPASPALAG